MLLNISKFSFFYFRFHLNYLYSAQYFWSQQLSVTEDCPFLRMKIFIQLLFQITETAFQVPQLQFHQATPLIFCEFPSQQ